MQKKTYMAKAADIKRRCYLINAQDQILGRVASRAASILQGKHKAIYTPHVDTGDMVIIINAAQVRTTGRKLQQKEYQRYSGYPSGQKSVPLKRMLTKKPKTVLQHAIVGMLPKGRLGAQMTKKLRIYADDQHAHAAQKPTLLEV